jgi:hypothetical protein
VRHCGPKNLTTPRLQRVQPGRPHHNQGFGVPFFSCDAGVSPAGAFKATQRPVRTWPSSMIPAVLRIHSLQ